MAQAFAMIMGGGFSQSTVNVAAIGVDGAGHCPGHAGHLPAMIDQPVRFLDADTFFVEQAIQQALRGKVWINQFVILDGRGENLGSAPIVIILAR